MRTSRLEAFSDGVLAIIITIMVLELDVPKGSTLADLRQAAGLGLLTYVLSFVYIGIYWSNHHHLFQLVDRVDGLVLWANLLLLFFLSLYPFTTAWMDQTRLEHQTPVVVYGVNLLLAAIAYSMLELAIFRANAPDLARDRLKPKCPRAGPTTMPREDLPGARFQAGSHDQRDQDPVLADTPQEVFELPGRIAVNRDAETIWSQRIGGEPAHGGRLAGGPVGAGRHRRQGEGHGETSLSSTAFVAPDRDFRP